jgi:hypothetical protein
VHAFRKKKNEFHFTNYKSWNSDIVLPDLSNLWVKQMHALVNYNFAGEGL